MCCRYPYVFVNCVYILYTFKIVHFSRPNSHRNYIFNSNQTFQPICGSAESVLDSTHDCLVYLTAPDPVNIQSTSTQKTRTQIVIDNFDRSRKPPGISMHCLLRSTREKSKTMEQYVSFRDFSTISHSNQYCKHNLQHHCFLL